MNQTISVFTAIIIFLFYVFVQSKKIFDYNNGIVSSQIFQEQTNTAPSKWNFFLSWIGASIIGLMTGWHVTTQITRNVFGYGGVFLVFLSVGTYSFVVSMSQWFILRLYIPRSILWVLLNSLISGIIVAIAWKQGTPYDDYDGTAFVIWHLASFIAGPVLTWQYSKKFHNR